MKRIMKKSKTLKKKNRVLEKTGSIASSISGTMGFLGGYQVCHNICLGIIALLSLIGITLVGMPLLFLTHVAAPLWIAAAALFLLTLVLYIKKRCVSLSMLLFNAGIIVAGFPFRFAQKASPLLWIVGGSFVVFGMVLFIRSRWLRRRRHGS